MSQDNKPPNGDEPSLPPSTALRAYWMEPVSRLASLAVAPMTDALKERHRIFSLLLMGLVARYWNGGRVAKRGPNGDAWS